LNDTSIIGQPSGFARIKLFFALSRTPHGLLDIATPALGALLWLGSFPSLTVVILGLMTAFAGYTAVYALNDLVDYRIDKERVQFGRLRASDNYLDDVLVRHPMAYGLLSFKSGLCWAVSWALLALLGAYILNPVCVFIFLGGCLLEIFYCLLLKISYLRALVSGVVKTTGAIAAVFAVDPEPATAFVITLFLWLFFWEVGGQNIPHDWADIEEDQRLETQTIPVRFGPKKSTTMILISLFLTVLFNCFVYYYSQAVYEILFVFVSAGIGLFLLISPAAQLYKKKDRHHAMALFNKASYYPLVLLIGVLMRLLLA
jgi:4-hydroxybenzoate polyprenyltransferase